MENKLAVFGLRVFPFLRGYSNRAAEKLALITPRSWRRIWFHRCSICNLARNQIRFLGSLPLVVHTDASHPVGSFTVMPRVHRAEKRDIVLGKIQGVFPRREKITQAQIGHHVHIVGASGYGKTVLLSHIIKQKISEGSGLLYIDLKGDVETIKSIRAMAKKANREADIEIFSISNPSVSTNYNILLRGTASELRDRIMMSLIWSEEYYKNQAGSFLLKALIGLCFVRDHAGGSFGISEVLRLASNEREVENLFIKVKSIPKNEKALSILESLIDFMRDKDNFRSLQGIRSQLESLILSDFGDLLSSDEEGINIFEAVKKNKIVMIFLDTRRYGESAKAIGKFVLQDLKATSARIDAEIPVGSRHPFAVVIDEFADLAQEDFIGFLDRARSSKMSIVVAHQEICDLERISPEFAGRLIGNTSTLYAFLQKRPESAEMISGIAGTRTVTKETRQVDSFFGFNVFGGKKSLRETEEYVIHPNVIKSLPVGRCVCVKKYPRASAHVVDVFKENN